MIGLGMDLPTRAAQFIRPPRLTGLQLWLRASSLDLSDGDPISTWVDESGNGNDATQGTGADQPTLKTGILNGLPVSRGDGSSDFLATPKLGASNSRTLFVVGRFVTDVGDWNERIVGLASKAGIFNDGSNYDYYANQADGVVSGGGTSSNFAVLAVVWSSKSSAEFFIDGTSVASFDPHDDFSNNLELGIHADSDSGNTPSNSDIAEIVVYNRALSSLERQQVEDYLNGKYSIF